MEAVVVAPTLAALVAVQVGLTVSSNAPPGSSLAGNVTKATAGDEVNELPPLQVPVTVVLYRMPPVRPVRPMGELPPLAVTAPLPPAAGVAVTTKLVLPLPGVKLTLAVLTVTLAMLTAVGAVQVATVVKLTVTGTDVPPPAQLLTSVAVYVVPAVRPLSVKGEPLTACAPPPLAGLVVTV